MHRPKLRYRILLYILPVIAGSLVAAGVLSDQAAEEELAVQAENQLTSVGAGVSQTIHFLAARLEQDVYLIAQTPELQNLMAYQEFGMPREAQATLQSFRRFLLDFERRAPAYFQLRYIDSEGMERVRIAGGREMPKRATPDKALLRQFSPESPYQDLVRSRTRLLGVRRIGPKGRLVLTAARMVHGAFTRPGRPHDYVSWGLVVVDVDWERMLDFLRSIKSAEVVISGPGGLVLAHPQREKVLNARVGGLDLIKRAIAGRPGQTHSQRLTWGAVPYQAVSELIRLAPGQDWVITVRARLADILRPVQKVRTIIIYAIFICVAVATLVILWLAGIITRPIQRLAVHTQVLAGGEFHAKVEVPRTQELATLAECFNQMGVELSDYIERLKRTTAEKERLASEMAIAAALQQSVLPARPPQYPGWDIAGLTLPARETGGDFYDYLQLPKGKLGFLVADVSGKGLPAALFMLSTRSALRTLATSGVGPARMLKRANRLVAEDAGDSGTFVTLFYGVLDPASGLLRYANAGHNPPLVLRLGGEVLELGRTGIPLGALEESSYRQGELILQPGESLVLYTDGVTENPDADNQEFGTRRLTELALALADRDAHATVERIKQDVFAFGGGQVQFDDLTLMVIKRSAPMPGPQAAFSLELTADLDALAALADFLAAKAQELELPEEALRALELSADEALTNVVNYAYPEGQPGVVRLVLEKDGEWVRLVIEDEGRPFDPEQVPEPDLDAPLEERRIGGLGLYLMDKMMDEVIRSREGGVNRLILAKRIA